MIETRFLNEEHRNIASITADIPGILVPGDHEALYETAFLHGDVILEIGAYAGMSAIIQLLGARANPARRNPPVYIGVDVDALAVFRTWNTLRKFSLEENSALFLGNLEAFRNACRISPTLVFLDGDHLYNSVRSDLECLETIAAPGTPILCHDYVHDPSLNLEARPAIDDFIKEGRATFERTLGARCVLIRLSATAKGPAPAGKPAEFATLRDRWLLEAGSSLAESWKRLNDLVARLKTGQEKAKQSRRSTVEKLQGRVDRLKAEAAEFRPLLGRFFYRGKKKDSGPRDAASS